MIKKLIFKLIKLFPNLCGYLTFLRQYKSFKRLMLLSNRNIQIDWKDRYPCLHDATTTTGFDRHYIYHPAWAARVLSKTRPAIHYDISSTLHFCSLVSAFIPVSFFDFRPPLLVLSNLKTQSANVTQLSWPPNSIESLSCMHVIEHIGLGRYGDPIDADGDKRAISELVRVLKPGGDLLVVVPVGRERICFNAHRVYNAKNFVNYFEGLDLIEFALIPDGEAPNGMLTENAFAHVDKQEYGCGCFWFKKSLQSSQYL